MIKILKELIEWLKEYKEWYNTNYPDGPQTQGGPGSNPPTPPPPPPGTNP